MEDRAGVERDLPMSLLVDDASVTCHILDVSPQGLCISCAQALTPGVVVRMQTLRRDVPLVVAWCREEAGEGFRCGLTGEPDVDLTERFSRLVAPAPKPRRARG
jgi:hypothetical protein